MWKNWQSWFDVASTVLLVVMTWILVAKANTASDLQAAGTLYAGG